MKVLIACEESQEVCKAFRALGHEAYSCDIQDCSGGHPEWHIQGDIINQISDPISGWCNPHRWDMIIAFPPCTDLAVSGAAWFEQKRKDGRQQKSIDFFMMFASHPCPKIAIENPIGIMSTIWRKPDQIIRPFQYGENSTKSTCLWLKGLQNLKPTNVIVPEKHITKSGKCYDKWWFNTCLISDLKKRASIRSKTFPGIAKAMAEQWGGKIG